MMAELSLKFSLTQAALLSYATHGKSRKTTSLSQLLWYN